jgi:membrane-bound serine protease (ClpP class)
VREPLDPEGQIFIAGALWRARVAAPESRLDLGTRVRVESVDGLTLMVQPAAEGRPAISEKGT